MQTRDKCGLDRGLRVVLCGVLFFLVPHLLNISFLAQKGQKAKKDNGSVPEGESPSTSPLARPFSRAWKYLTDNGLAISPSLDDKRIFLPLPDGSIHCLDLKTGVLMWTADPGGVVTAPIVVSGNAVYVVTKKVSDDGAEIGAAIRTLDASTGLTLWVQDYGRAFASPLIIAGERLYVGSSDGSLYALSADKGEVIWKAASQDVVRGAPLVTDKLIIFGSDDGSVRAVDKDHGAEIWKYQTGGRVVGQPAANGRDLFIGSGDSYFYSIDLASGKLRWRTRAGAGIEATGVIAGDRVLIGSLDDFVYAFLTTNGYPVWKRRMEGRVQAPALVVGDAALVTPYRGDHVAVFLVSDGRRVSSFQLDAGYQMSADPSYIDGRIILPTDKGLVVAESHAPLAPSPKVPGKE